MIDAKEAMKVIFVKAAEVKKGDKLMADGGFTCLHAGTILEVKENDTSDLYVCCNFGKHYLVGQENEADELTGLTKII